LDFAKISSVIKKFTMLLNPTYKINIHGGSWNYNIFGLRVYDRNIREPTFSGGYHDVGFRCVLIP